jgi:glycosyltransferase involved in cell wall biosynthesis
MRILFVHQNFPGQYKHIAPTIAAVPGNEVVALTINAAPDLPGVRVIRYRPAQGSTATASPWLTEIEAKAIRGEAVARAALHLRAEGFIPDVICAHLGWGEALFLKDVFPESRLLGFMEFYYSSSGADVGFDPEYCDESLESKFSVRLKNANNLLSLEACDWALSPTEWQRRTVPLAYREKVFVIHDGFDTRRVRPMAERVLKVGQEGVRITSRDEIITFVSRNLEPYRGFNTFMRALPRILRNRPKARALIVGGDGVSYGRPLLDGRSYREKLLAECGSDLDLSRVHFLGQVPHDVFLAVLQVSAAHIYLTYPFVLSWSMIEAMAAGCLVIGSATPPVEEVIEDGVNGLLVDFFSPDQIADSVNRVFDHPDRMQSIRRRARRTAVERYDLSTVCLPQHLALIEALARGQVPAVHPAIKNAGDTRISRARANPAPVKEGM